MSDRRILEICCDSLESALAAAGAGADRIELCVDLPEDGLTPPVDRVCAVKAVVAIPVFVLVRCRAGGFVYSAAELAAMCGEIEAMRECGADGIVCGALAGDGTIDQVATRRMISAARGLPVTFHRAFDACSDLERGMLDLAGLGVERVLTSGGARLAVDAIPRLARLAELGRGGTRVLCGGGVRSANVSALIPIPGVLEFHSAARGSAGDPVDASEVRALRAALDRPFPS